MKNEKRCYCSVRFDRCGHSFQFEIPSLLMCVLTRQWTYVGFALFSHHFFLNGEAVGLEKSYNMVPIETITSGFTRA